MASYGNLILLYVIIFTRTYIHAGGGTSRPTQEFPSETQLSLVSHVLDRYVLIVPEVSHEPLTDSELNEWLDKNISPEGAHDSDIKKYFAQFKDRPELFKARCRLIKRSIGQPAQIKVRDLLPKLKENVREAIITRIVQHVFDRANMLRYIPNEEGLSAPLNLTDNTPDIIEVLIQMSERAS